MNSSCLPEFWERYKAHPPAARTAADACSHSPETVLVFIGKPARFPSAYAVKGNSDWWSIRIGDHYRALCVRDGQDCVWFFIGSHADYNALVP